MINCHTLKTRSQSQMSLDTIIEFQGDLRQVAIQKFNFIMINFHDQNGVPSYN